METLTLILSAIAALASVISVILGLVNNRRQKKHLKNRFSVLDNVYNGPMGQYEDYPGRDNGHIELETLKKDLKL